jgi:hypothetical protein
MTARTSADTGFALKTVLIILVVHAIAYLTHEFSHSAMAWALGYMENPFALDYGALTPGNLVMLFEVDDNVQYEPILHSGHGIAVTIIALSGAFIGNGLFYVLLYKLTKRLQTRNPLLLSIVFWSLVMCAGNIWSYVPIRAITTHADIALAAQGLHLSVFALFPFLLVLSLGLVVHFFARVCPMFISAIAPGGTARTAMMVATTAAWFFFFYGGVGLFGNYGPVSQSFSLVSAIVFMPVASAWLWQRCTVTD